MEGRRRVKEQLKKLAAHDYAKTAFSYIERDTGREVMVEVAEHDLLEPVNSHPLEGRRPDVAESTPVPQSTETLIGLGESLTVEFKRSARWNESKGAERIPALELAILKTVAGLMNATGGGLFLIGVGDDGEVVGLEADYRTISNGDGIATRVG